ncbi:mechanosensitive ion channel [Candidatus Gracilibacteria bacterium]|nr:mechanosensitive ion channel [Candidatus Gracilibacteria bacterium]
MQNYLYTLLGITYFLFFFVSKNHIYLNSYLNQTKYLNIVLPYLNAFIAIFTIIGIIGLVDTYLELILIKKKNSNKSKLAIVFNEFLIKFINIVKYLIAVYLGIKFINIPDNITLYINQAFKVSFIIVFLFLSNGLIKIIFKSMTSKKDGDDLSKQVFPILGGFITVFVWIVGILTILGNLGYDVSALVAGAGVGGIAIALAAQKSIANVFGAISIILNKPFKIGETIRINDFTGDVKKIGITYLELTDLTGNKILIPNETLISSSIENLTQRENRKTDIIIGVVYETSLDKLKKAVKLVEDLLETYIESLGVESYRVYFDNFGSYSLDIHITYFSLENDHITLYYKQKEKINFQIKELFEKHNIIIAFPTQEIIIKK